MFAATGATPRTLVAPLPLLLALLLAFALLAIAPTPAHAESECQADAQGDVVRRDDESVSDKPEVDILVICLSHTPDDISVTVRVTSPTDPATHPAWEDFGAAIGVAVDTDGDGTEDFDLNYGRFPDGTVQVGVFEHEEGGYLCEGDGTFDGVRYRLTASRDCLGNPQQVSMAAFMFYESVSTEPGVGFFDEVPAYPELAGPYSTAPDPETAAVRLEGPSRVDTAIAVSQDTFEDGAAEAVVLARAELFPDALVATPLAVAKNAPLLLTPSHAVAQIVEHEIERVLPEGGTVYLSGGTAALSDDVVTELEDLGFAVERLAGDTRYETAVAVASEAVAEPELIVVSDGNTFPDALVGGSLAAFEGGVEIISDGTQLDESATAYLQAHPDAEVVAVGQVAAEAVPDATAIVGEDAFATSVAVARARYPEASSVTIASGTNFPDGLTGGAHAARNGAPLLLTTPDLLSEVVADYLAERSPLQSVTLYGGTVALSYEVERQAATAVVG